jgi:hypothetical protein
MKFDPDDLPAGYGDAWEVLREYGDATKRKNAARMRDGYKHWSQSPAWRAKKAAAVRRWRARQPPRPFTVKVKLTIVAKSVTHARAFAKALARLQLQAEATP